MGRTTRVSEKECVSGLSVWSAGEWVSGQAKMGRTTRVSEKECVSGLSVWSAGEWVSGQANARVTERSTSRWSER